MVFLFQQTTSNAAVKTRSFFVPIYLKTHRKRLSKFLKRFQFSVPTIKITLTCFPKIQNYHKYNVCDFNQTLRSQVIELLTQLNTEGYFVVAEVEISIE